MLVFEIFFVLLFFGIVLVLLGFVAYCLFWITKRILFIFHYSPPKESKGVIADMEFEKSYTTYNGTSAVHHPEKNVVKFKTPQGLTEIDSDTLYQRVRIGEEITVKYQDRYREPRFWSGDLVFDGMRLLSIVCYRDQEVEFNSTKETSKKLAAKLEMCEFDKQ